MMPAPDGGGAAPLYHFVFGLRPQRQPFHIAWYLCLRSCLEVNRPRRVLFHYRFPPFGPWWDRIRPHLELCRLEPGTLAIPEGRYLDHDEGRFIRRHGLDYAHRADRVRLAVLDRHGGVYADIDTLFVRPLPRDLMAHPCVLGFEDDEGGESGPSLCNAVIVARPGAPFIRHWLERFDETFDGTWSRHSNVEATRLWRQMPDQLHTVARDRFYPFPATVDGIADLFLRCRPLPQETVSMHLWSHLWWEPWRRDFTTFHHGLLTERHIRTVDTTYNLAARGFLD